MFEYCYLVLFFNSRKRYRDWLRFWAHLALLILVIFTIVSFFGDKVLILIILILMCLNFKISVFPYLFILCKHLSGIVAGIQDILKSQWLTRYQL